MSKYIGDVSAYAYAVSKGYTGTEEEFAELMADYADVGQTAVTAAQTATTKASEAATSATTATNKATEASTSATSASGSATAASASASAASGSATSAAASATAASGSATAAAGSATTASTKASEASASATAAQTAQTAAETAQSAAETAQGKAEDAQEAAETTAQSISASAAQIATNTADITQLKSEVSALPTDGVVANSKQLLSENGTDNTEPYTFRAVPVNADRAELNAVVGVSVPWNQLVRTYSKAGAESTSFNAGTTLTAGHKMFLSYKRDANTSNTFVGIYTRENDTNSYFGLSLLSNGALTGATIKVVAVGGTSNGTSQNTNGNVWMYQESTPTVTDVMLIDLTQIFGPTIADYIYNLETATPGAGVAWFKKLFPADYYPYDAGTLKHVEGVSEKATVGSNQWDEEVELGYYSTSDGEPVSSNQHIRNKNYIPVIPNTTYYFKTSGYNCNIQEYDSDKQWIKCVQAVNNQTLLLAENCKYIRFNAGSSYGTTYKNDICINISDPAKNGTYKPYEKHSYPLDPTVVLRGIPKLSDGKLYYDGDRYLPDGTVERRYGIRAYQSGDESLADAITDETNTVYKLTTPTTETADPYQSLQVCDPNGTEEFVTTGIVPVGHETRYPENLRAKIEGLPWDFSSLIAPTEKTTTASRNYTTGSLLIMNNVLYKVTANIANGGTITPNTNATATTLSEVISALQ